MFLASCGTTWGHTRLLHHVPRIHMHAPPAPGQARRRRICATSQARAAYNEGGPAAEETITSLQNALVKHCVKVRQNRGYREEEGTVVLSGSDLVAEVAEHGAQVKVLFVMQGALVPDAIAARRVVRVSPAVMQKVTGLESVNAATLAAEVVIPAQADFRVGWRQGQLTRLLVLERLQDPGNLGTLLRTALALGWQGALLLPGCCDPYNDKALRASRGAAFKLPLASGTLQDLRRIAASHQLVCLAAEPHATGAAGNGAGRAAERQRQPAAAGLEQQPQQSAVQQQGQVKSITSDDDEFENWLWGAGGGPLSAAAAERSAAHHAAAPQQQQGARLAQRGVCLVLGSEGQGLSDEVLELSIPINVPMVGDMESLNVGAAGAILMFMLSPGAPKLQSSLNGMLRPQPAQGQQAQQQTRQAGPPPAQQRQQAARGGGRGGR